MKLRVTLYGGRELVSAADALGLIPADAGTAALALIDLREPGSVAQAAALPAELPRVVVGDEAQIELAGALGMVKRSVARSCEPAELGPLIAATLPARRRQATRSVLVTSVRGGVGRSLLAANLARRLAPTRSTLALDVTGTGALAWWLGSTAASWADLEGLTDELSAEHLAVVATETAPGLRLVGGPPSAPSASLACSALRAALGLAEIAIVDAPSLADERTRQLLRTVDRVVVLTYDDPVSIAALAAADIPEDSWLVASQSAAASLCGRDVFRALPRAEAAIVAAASRPSAVAGALGSAYDELAEIVAIDST